MDEPPSYRWIVIGEDNNISIRCCVKDCSANFENSADLRQHMFDDHIMPAVQENFTEPRLCDVNGCQMEVADVSLYARHLVFHCYHQELLYKGAKELSSNSMTQGRTCKNQTQSANNVYYGGEYMQCCWHSCESGFDDVSEFFKHVRYHLDEFENKDKKFQCFWEGCSFSTAVKKTLSVHLIHHSGEKVIACPTCGSFFSNITKFVDHVIRQCVSEDAKLKCFLCNKLFCTERLLREHSRRHINTHKCPFCEMTISGPHNLRLHMKDRHAESKDHVCTFCLKTFAREYDLRRHLSAHTSTGGQFTCKACDMKFKTKTGYSTHLRLHKSPTYACHLCDKRYSRGSSLSAHLIDAHKLKLPPGHCRFTYKKCADELHRLQTERYESIGLSVPSGNGLDDECELDDLDDLIAN